MNPIFKRLSLVLSLLAIMSIGSYTYGQSSSPKTEKETFLESMSSLPETTQKMLSENYETLSEAQKKNFQSVAKECAKVNATAQPLPYTNREEKLEWLKTHPIEGLSDK